MIQIIDICNTYFKIESHGIFYEILFYRYIHAILCYKQEQER